MRKFLPIFLTFFATICFAQERYLSQVFTKVDRQQIAYGKNYTVLLVPTTGRTKSQPLAADVYRPNGDTETKRPLIIYLHTGNFLPYPQNSGASGTIRDSTVVDFCTKFAKMGYVVASADYRTGWNPIAATPEGRVSTLINAAYRGVHDARAAIRFFKANAATFGVDTTKIMLFGQGTGGYVSLAAASLDKYTEILTTTAGANKFIGSNSVPYVIEKVPFPNPAGVLYINSDVEGKNFGFVPPNADGTPNAGPPPTGDTLNFPNNPTRTSSFAMAVNMGGALGDISWIDANTPPIVCIQAPYDPFAPYDDAVLSVPIPGGSALPVVRVQGSLAVQKKLEELGKNDIFKKLDPAKDPIGKAIKGKQGGLINLFPIIGTKAPLDSSPWDFWDPATNTNHATAIQTNSDMTAAKGRRYIDSVIMFVAPRACIGLNLPCKVSVSVGTNDLTDADVALLMAPNPATSEVNFKVAQDKPIKSLEVLDITGRLITAIKNINSSEYRLNRQSINSGMYFVKLNFDNGSLTKKLFFE
jgi:dienelactone hydrolase